MLFWQNGIDGVFRLGHRVRVTIGEKIRKAREEAGWTLSELADELGVSVSTLSRLETGERRMPYDLVEKIADVLEIPMRRLVA